MLRETIRFYFNSATPPLLSLFVSLEKYINICHLYEALPLTRHYLQVFEMECFID